jgi:hypothetical protein
MSPVPQTMRVGTFSSANAGLTAASPSMNVGGAG